MKRIIYLTLCIVLFLGIKSTVKAQSFYQKKSTWMETMLASRIEIEKQLRKTAGSPKLILGSWYSVGPLLSKTGHSFPEAFPPEPNFNLKDEYEGGKFKWVEQPAWKDGQVVEFEYISNSAVYLQRTISYVNDTSAVCYFGSDDGIKIWLNGTVVFEKNIDRACAPNQDMVELKLKKGENKLVLKINNNGGGFGFYFSTVTGTPSEMVWQKIDRDFTRPEEMRQINWEKQDSIWEADFSEDNYTGLAKKYADVVKDISPELYTRISQASLNVKTVAELMAIRKEYINAKLSEYRVLTPAPSEKPKINGAKIYGVRPNAPFLFRIAATGKRPMEFSAENLPKGLSLDKNTGIITGAIKRKAKYNVLLKAKNSLGTAERNFVIVCGNRIALTPPMGWNSWNCFANAVSDEKVRKAADAMVKSGLIDHGWSYVNIDDFWEINLGSSDPDLKGEPRDKDGFINTNRKFPDMKALGDYIHSNGLKMGIYSSPGPYTCGGCIASYGYEDKDAKKYGEWGVDYLKYDWCSYSEKAKGNSLSEFMKPYYVMRKQLNKVNRDIVYSLCQYGMGNVWEWGDKVGGNCWRTTGDITDTWKSMTTIGFNQAGHEKYAKPGNWNDPDMLVVGMVGWGPNLHPTRLTANEQYTHISLWSLLASPLLIGCDMTQMDDFTLSLLTNDEVIEVNQDPLGKQAARISVQGNLEVWAKQMEDGSMAVGLFNRGNSRTEVTADFKSLNLTGTCLVRDLWQQKDLGQFSDSFKSPVAAHGVKLVRISKVK